MTISSTVRKAGPYSGNGATVSFPFTFKVFSASDVLAVRADAAGTETTLALTTDYTVSLNADQNASPGGTVIPAVVLAAGLTLTISSALEYLQPVDLTNNGGFYPAVLNTALDRLTILIQQLAEKVSRGLKMAISTPPGVDPTLPVPAPYKIIGWNGAGTGFQNTDPSGSSALAADLAATGAAMLGGGTQITASVAALRTLSKASASKNSLTTGYYTAGDGGGDAYYLDAADTASVDNGGSIIVATDGGRWKLADTTSMRVERFGAKGDGVTDCTNAVLKAIAALRRNAVSIFDDIGGSMITAYSSGVLDFGPGVFVVSADALAITQDLGLIFRGKGSRRTNNAVRAATTLLVSGTSSGFGIKFWNNGARAATIEDMDICYADANFTGDVLDTLNCPGLTLNRAFLGTFGLSGATRLQTARSLIRATYDEFLHATDCVFDGAVDGFWSDDVRLQNGNSFGGALTTFDNCVFYDFTGRPLRADGNRTRTNLTLNNVACNPISVNCVRSIDLNNIDGLIIAGGICAGSVANHATAEWMRLVNCTGHVRGVLFDDNSKVGTIDGMLDFSSNRIYATDGVTLKGGVITGRNNEFAKGTNGWTLSPSYPLSADIGPDLFKSGITGYSYYVPADSANLAARINYESGSDASISGISSLGTHVSMNNIDGGQSSIAATTYSINNKTDGGRTIVAIGASAQTFLLPYPAPGRKFKIVKLAAVGLRIDAAVGGTLYTGSGGGKTSMLATNPSDLGGYVELEAYGTTGWIVRLTGAWTLS